MATEKQTGSQQGGSGNFANDPERASEAGKNGGEHSHGGTQQSEQGGSRQGSSQQGGSRGGQGSFANDPEKASEAGKKGGENSHGGR